jgi:NADPH-dependent glutamate synthase beta subunit-like oxidoreductase
MLESLSDNIVIDKAKCTACGICVDKCILDNLRLNLSPCRQACPLGVNCQGYVQLIARGEEDKAMELLRETLPFPGILGRICSQPCEDSCYRRQTDGEAVAVRALKRYLADCFKDGQVAMPPIGADTGHKVAVVGSGPAGMLAAFDLRTRGHQVTIFEADEAPGGMLRWAIPDFRMPLAVLEQELDLLRRMGVDFRCGVALGKDQSLEELKQTYQAVVIAVGCPEYTRLNTEDEDLPGIYYGLAFLREVRAGNLPAVGARVVVIGGGNVAVDAAQTALRLGAADVAMVCLESDEEVPAFRTALNGALAEGIKLECSWGSVKFLSSGGKLEGVSFQRCLKVFDECGQFQPIFDACELKDLQADTVIVAIGQQRNTALLTQIGLTDEMITRVDPLTLQTADERIFIAGDVVSGPSSVVDAMAKGRRAAESVHRYLQGEHMHYGRRYAGPVETEFDIEADENKTVARARIPERLCAGKGDFNEIEEAFDARTARQEAGRCHSCGTPFGKYRTCWFCLPCEVECPNDALYVEIPYLLR